MSEISCLNDTAAADRRLWSQLSAHYQSEAALLPELAAQHGLDLESEIAATLRGHELSGELNTTGLPRASFKIGQAVNGRVKPKALLHGKAKLPSHDALRDLSEHHLLNPTSRAFFKLLEGVFYPQQSNDITGQTVLPRRSAEEAYQVSNNQIAWAGARCQSAFCADAERYFVEEGFDSGELRPIKMDGQVVALKKELGDKTALLTVPAILNGVSLPVGSLLATDTKWRNRNVGFAFGRFSLFNYVDPEQALREMPEIALRKFSKPEQRERFIAQLAIFNEIIGRTVSEQPEAPQPAAWEESLSGLLIGSLEMALDVKHAEAQGVPASWLLQQNAVARLQKARLEQYA